MIEHINVVLATSKTWLLPKRAVWIYPDQEKPPSGKILLLTIGNIAVTGVWTEDGRYKAWQHLLKRDKAHEAELGYE